MKMSMLGELDREEARSPTGNHTIQYLDILALLCGLLPPRRRFIYGMTSTSRAFANTLGIRLRSNCWAVSTESEHAESTCERGIQLQKTILRMHSSEDTLRARLAGGA
jgi:hypothetical protein